MKISGENPKIFWKKSENSTKAAIGSAIARQAALIEDSDSDGVPSLTKRDESSSGVEDEDIDT